MSLKIQKKSVNLNTGKGGVTLSRVVPDEHVMTITAITYSVQNMLTY